MAKLVVNVSMGFVSFTFMHSAAQGSTGQNCASRPHTTSAITVNKPALCSLSKLFEVQNFCLVDGSGNDIAGQAFAVAPGQNAEFGMVLMKGADFNMEFALTCVASDGALMKSPKAIFNIGANGPADPSVSITNLYGAKGSWTATDHGEDFSVNF